MPELDIDKGLITYLRTLFPSTVVITDRFPLDGAFAADRLIVARMTYGADLDPRFNGSAEVTVDDWFPTRNEALDAALTIKRGLTRMGGFDLIEDGVRTGVVTQGTATLWPIREPSGDANDVYVRYVATYDLSVRALASA